MPRSRSKSSIFYTPTTFRAHTKQKNIEPNHYNHVAFDKWNTIRVPLWGKNKSPNLDLSIIKIKKTFPAILDDIDIADILGLSVSRVKALLIPYYSIEQEYCVLRTDFIQFLRDHYHEVP